MCQGGDGGGGGYPYLDFISTLPRYVGGWAGGVCECVLGGGGGLVG